MKQLLTIIIPILILCGCSDPTCQRITKGHIVEVSFSPTDYVCSSTRYARVNIRIDCKNPTCDIKTFYFKKTIDLENTVLNAQEFNEKVIIYYNNWFLINFAGDILISRMESLSNNVR